MNSFRITHQGCASLLRYVLGDGAHIRTLRRPDGRIAFEFDDPDDKAAELADLFFSHDGIATGNARQLLDCDRAVRATVGACFNSGEGEWRNPDA